MYRVVLSSEARRIYEEANVPLARKLVKCFARIEADPRSGNNVKPLKGPLAGRGDTGPAITASFIPSTIHLALSASSPSRIAATFMNDAATIAADCLFLPTCTSPQ
jgi:hypothetical protein